MRMYLHFKKIHVIVSQKLAMSEGGVSLHRKEKKKMKYQYDKYKNFIPPSHVTSYGDKIQDTKILVPKYIEFLRRVEAQTTYNMVYIKESYIYFVGTFLVASMEIEFIMELYHLKMDALSFIRPFITHPKLTSWPMDGSLFNVPFSLILHNIF